jgi:rod shape-determining protein MreD
MSFQAARPLDAWNWLIVPGLVCLAASLILAIPVRVFGFGLPEPVFVLVPTFVWAVVRPSILPPIILFGLGICLDLIWGGTLGVWPLSILMGYTAVLATRAIAGGQGREANWIWFGLMCLLVELVAFLITVVSTHVIPNLVAAGWQWLVTIALYPVAHRLIERFEDTDVRYR